MPWTLLLLKLKPVGGEMVVAQCSLSWSADRSRAGQVDAGIGGTPWEENACLSSAYDVKSREAESHVTGNL
ncbi:hypothetical protein Mapa_013206 [Marchantia paleacea]|nr:hypothetical protein Mapa_013206 [Marchantia paleacea]